METMTEYVIRKLQEPGIKIAGVAEALNINRSKIYRLIRDKDGTASVVQKLNDYFKALAD